MMNYSKILQTHLKTNNNVIIAINRLQESGLDSQQASLWVISRILDNLDPLEELQAAIQSRN